MRDPYQILGISRDATEEEIKKVSDFVINPEKQTINNHGCAAHFSVQPFAFCVKLSFFKSCEKLLTHIKKSDIILCGYPQSTRLILCGYAKNTLLRIFEKKLAKASAVGASNRFIAHLFCKYGRSVRQRR